MEREEGDSKYKEGKNGVEGRKESRGEEQSCAG